MYFNYDPSTSSQKQEMFTLCSIFNYSKVYEWQYESGKWGRVKAKKHK